MMPLRVWEFLIGYGVAYYFTNFGRVRYAQYGYLGTVGLVIILLIPLMHLEAETMNFVEGHPGLHALFITLATGLVLTFGILKSLEYSKIGTLLETLGEYSYSIYLVHFPIIVLYLYEPFSGTVLKMERMEDGIMIFLLIVLCSITLYHLVEVASKKIKHLIRYLWFAPLIIVATALAGTTMQEHLYNKEELLISNTFKDRDVYRCGKLNRILNPQDKYCKLTASPSSEIEQRIMLIGNSHADSIKKTFAEEATKLKSEVFFMVSNEPLFKGEITAQEIIEDALAYKIDTMVLHYSFSKVPLVLKNIKKLVVLSEKHNINIDFIMPVPYWDRAIPKALWEHKHEGVALPLKTMKEYGLKNRKTLDYFNKINARNFKIYETAPFFCNNECLYVNEEGRPLYFDEGHLTLTGSNYLRKLFKEIIKSHLKLAK
jgi:hypothetical protein